MGTPNSPGDGYPLGAAIHFRPLAGICFAEWHLVEPSPRIATMLSADAVEGQSLRIYAVGKLTAADYRNFEPEFERALARTIQPAPLLLDLRGFRGWTVGGLLRDIIFDVRHRTSFSRLAVIGDKKWHSWIIYAGIPVFRARLKFFKPSDEELALHWLQQSA